MYKFSEKMFSSKVMPDMAQNVRIIIDLKGLNKTNSFFIDFVRLFSEKKTDGKVESERIKEFRKKLRERTPLDKLPEFEEGKHPYQEKEPLKSFPDNKNPKTGEINGPRGPEPTRYGDWERKGRVSDF
ncbi:hypothetical protein V1478_012377 [Vespula squamosa]|uniref:Succinate dehydrogenase assembly factor 4, mitochondrial n=1 Tax=Vespula squamosa TaxID=30214 RepID=A0ABD2AD34_VESSQ